MTIPTPLNYRHSPRISRLAITSMIIGIISLPLFFLGIPALISLVFAWVAGYHLSRQAEPLGGEAYLKAGQWLSVSSLLLFVAFIVFIPSMGCRHGHGTLSRRSYCAANLRGIMQAMNVYANDNEDKFPTIACVPYTPAHNDPSSALGTSNSADTITAMVTAPPANIAGSPSANAWILVLGNYVSPKQFICKNDPFVTGPAAVTDAGRYHMNFSSGKNLSYSFAYPWTSDGKRAWWWTNIVDSGIPIMSDMAPLQGSGTPRRVLNPAIAPADNRTWNSANHDGDGQNVAFSDAHVEWTRRPDVGQHNDNIFTTSGANTPLQFGGTPATPLFPLTPPYTPAPGTPLYPDVDIIMVPVRDAATGAM